MPPSSRAATALTGARGKTGCCPAWTRTTASCSRPTRLSPRRPPGDSGSCRQEPKRLVHVLADFANATVPMTAPFVEDFYARLQAQGPALALVQAWLEHQLSDQGLSAVQLLEAASRSAAADQISIANSVGSLRFISALDWGKFVEDLSLVEQMLRLDPARVYADQDFLTRD